MPGKRRIARHTLLSGCMAIFTLVACADLSRGAKLAVGAKAVVEAKVAARITGRSMLPMRITKSDPNM